MSGVRKPLDPRCDGNFDCPVPGHAIVQRRQNGRYTYKHAPLTPGQKATLRERREKHWKAVTSDDRA